ncbi:MAG: hypothetical protein KDE46_18105 [Caldilineaceae bacterium]|nr:hypothetical protein [Caldilineaceae bacterium]
MVKINNPLLFILLGGILIFVGFGAVFGMVLRLWQAGFALSFLAYASSLVGLLLSLLGILEFHQRDDRY